MADMNYCRFHNTTLAMEDCDEQLGLILEGESSLKELSPSERKVLEKMHGLAHDMCIAFQELNIDKEY